jgi:hypothetical protein
MSPPRSGAFAATEVDNVHLKGSGGAPRAGSGLQLVQQRAGQSEFTTGRGDAVAGALEAH